MLEILISPIFPAASTTNAKTRCHQQSLEIVQQSTNVLAALANDPDDVSTELLNQMLATIQTDLRNLIKSSLTSKSTKLADTYKRVYALTLRRDCIQGRDNVALHMHRVALALAGEIGRTHSGNY